MKYMSGTSSDSSEIKDSLTERVIGCAIKLHRTLGPGFLENIYHQALAYELGKASIPYINEARMQVKYEEIVLGDYVADFLVDERVVVEIKAVETLTKAHEIQLVNYLNAIRFEIGLLINFGSGTVQVKRKYRTLRAQTGLSFPPVPHVSPV